jgi:hypothetical protein
MKRPLAVTITGWIFILAGAVGFVYHIREVNIHDLFGNDAVWTQFVRVLAIVGGILSLRGSNFGRWLVIIWMAYHVVLSYFHTVPELMMHFVILAGVCCALFYSKANDLFRKRR